MSRYLGFIEVVAFGLLLFTATASVEQARSEEIFTTSGGSALATIDPADASGASLVGPFKLPQPAGGLSLAVSGAFSANGTLFTLINTVAPEQQDVSHQLGIIQKSGKIKPVGDVHTEFNLVAMEIDSENNILATGFDQNPNPPFPFNWFGDSMLYNVDSETGARTPIGDTGITDGPIMDLAFNSEGTLYATTRNKLWTLDTTNGAASSQVDISGVTGGEIMSIFFDAEDTLLGIDVVSGDLFTIDPASGAAGLLKETGLSVPDTFAHGGDTFLPPTAPGILLNPGLNNPGLGGQLPPGLRDGLPSQSHHAVPEPVSVVLLLIGCCIFVPWRRRR